MPPAISTEEETVSTVPVHSGLHFVSFIQPVGGFRVMQHPLAAMLEVFSTLAKEALSS